MDFVHKTRVDLNIYIKITQGTHKKIMHYIKNTFMYLIC